MLVHKRKRQGTDYVEPDLPITPMLDMSFQLLAFFIMTFQPPLAERKFELAFPRDEGVPTAPQRVVEDPDKPKYFVARVAASERGTIERITFGEEGDFALRDLGANVPALRDELTAVSTKLAHENRTGKLRLELDDKLVQAFVVQLVDTGVRAGFGDISPVPLGKTRR